MEYCFISEVKNFFKMCICKCAFDFEHSKGLRNYKIKLVATKNKTLESSEIEIAFFSCCQNYLSHLELKLPNLNLRQVSGNLLTNFNIFISNRKPKQVKFCFLLGFLR